MTHRRLSRSAGRRRPRNRRRGVTAVEFSVVAPLLFFMVFASIEFSRAVMAIQSVEEAVRAGCRVAILEGATDQMVQDAVDSVLAPNGISKYTLTINPTNLSTAEQWDPITVSATFKFGDVSWLGIPMYIGGLEYTASCTLPNEGVPLATN